jgi:hypothetical protein
VNHSRTEFARSETLAEHTARDTRVRTARAVFRRPARQLPKKSRLRRGSTSVCTSSGRLRTSASIRERRLLGLGNRHSVSLGMRACERVAAGAAVVYELRTRRSDRGRATIECAVAAPV